MRARVFSLKPTIIENCVEVKAGSVILGETTHDPAKGVCVETPAVTWNFAPEDVHVLPWGRARTDLVDQDDALLAQAEALLPVDYTGYRVLRMLEDNRAVIDDAGDVTQVVCYGDDRSTPVNLRYVEAQECVTCASGEYVNDDRLTFVCNRPGGPRWRGGEETEHVCDLWGRVEGE